MTESSKLAIVVHGDGGTTVFDERQAPVLCKDCRFSGWLREYDYNFEWFKLPWLFSGEVPPTHCLHYSGCADPVNGSRVICPQIKNSNWPDEKIWKRYPETNEKNVDGKCQDFVPSKPRSWFARWLRSGKAMRL